MSDVSAILLSIGENTHKRALESIESQTMPFAEIIQIKNVSPFSKAFIQGARSVKTPFFLQCDADMILSPDCGEYLRAGMNEQIAVCAGYLQDDILGPLQAVKLFRTEAVSLEGGSSIAHDSDMIIQMFREGWKINYCRRSKKRYGLESFVFGKHSPNYDDEEYTFYKFFRQGTKARYRKSFPEYESYLTALKKSCHPMANLALTAFCHGVFSDDTSDLHVSSFKHPEFSSYKNLQRAKADLETLVFSPIRIPGLDVSVYP